MHLYLQKYADTFHITERIRFQNQVISIDKSDPKNPNLPWIVQVETVNGHHQTFEFALVVVATGLFSTPKKPVLRGENKFAGSIVHACDIKTREQLENKRVAVIGGAKSAADLATLAGTYARSCHMIFRRSHWLISYDFLHGYLPFEYMFTRVFTVIFDPYPYAPHSILFNFFHRTFSFITKKVFEIMSTDMINSFQSDLYANSTFLPKGSFRHAENYLRITEDFRRLIREGRIIRKLGSVDDIIDETTIRLDSGEQLQVDLIVCATGFTEQFSFFSPTLGRALGQNRATSASSDETDLDLYRRIVPVGMPNIAFVGCSTAVTQWMFFEVQSHWISEYFLGRLQLPTTETAMYDEIRTTRDFLRKQFNRNSYNIQYYWLEPIEIYLKDMGVSLHRTNNWVSEYFGIYRPRRLKHIHHERQAKAEGKTASIWNRHWYFGFGHTVLLLFFILCIWIFF